MFLLPSRQLSEVYTVSDLSRTECRTVDNTPDEYLLNNLITLAQNLEKLQLLIGLPIHITSAFRCKELNLIVGGSVHSDHCLGLAADFTVHNLSLFSLFNFLYKNRLRIGYRQLIWEYGRWVHISWYVEGSGQTPKHLETLVINKKEEGYLAYKEGMDLNGRQTSTTV